MTKEIPAEEEKTIKLCHACDEEMFASRSISWRCKSWIGRFFLASKKGNLLKRQMKEREVELEILPSS